MRRVVMKAVRIHKFGGPEVLQVENDVPIPSIQSDQVLINVKAAGVNPVETYIRSGNYAFLPDLPAILGGDAAGIVSAVGDAVHHVKPGDRVFCARGSGTYAEYAVRPGSSVWSLPDRLTFSQGASLGIPYFTALRALKFKANTKAGERVLVHGASGAVGLAACQLAKNMGLEVIGTAGTEEGARLAREAGASQVLNHRDKDHATKLQEVAGEKGFDVVLEMLANVNLQLDFDVAASYGRIVVIGSKGKISVDPRTLMLKETMCTGMSLRNTPAEEWKEMGEHISRGLREGWINPVVDQEYPLDQVATAHRAVIDHGDGAKGKIVLVMN